MVKSAPRRLQRRGPSAGSCVLGALVAGLGCSEGADTPAGRADVVVDSAGVRVVTMSLPRSLPTGSAVRVGTLAGGPEAEPFPSIENVRLREDGGVVVLDDGNATGYVFDGRRRFTGTFGRRGRGPGEFMSPSGLWTSGDTISVLDSGLDRLSRFVGETIVETLPIDGLPPGPVAAGDSEVRGVMPVVESGIRIPMGSDRMRRGTDSLHMFLVPREGGEATRWFGVPDVDYESTQSGGRATGRGRFGLLWHLGPRGMVAISPRDSLAVHLLDPTEGRIRTIRVLIDESTLIPDAERGLFVGRSLDVWIATPTPGEAGMREWVVVDSAGNATSVSLPARFRPLDDLDDLLAGVSVDELGVGRAVADFHRAHRYVTTMRPRVGSVLNSVYLAMIAPTGEGWTG